MAIMKPTNTHKSGGDGNPMIYAHVKDQDGRLSLSGPGVASSIVPVTTGWVTKSWYQASQGQRYG
jgi:hypothetical protein